MYTVNYVPDTYSRKCPYCGLYDRPDSFQDGLCPRCWWQPINEAIEQVGLRDMVLDVKRPDGIRRLYVIS